MITIERKDLSALIIMFQQQKEWLVNRNLTYYNKSSLIIQKLCYNINVSVEIS